MPPDVTISSVSASGVTAPQKVVLPTNHVAPLPLCLPALPVEATPAAATQETAPQAPVNPLLGVTQQSEPSLGAVQAPLPANAVGAVQKPPTPYQADIPPSETPLAIV